MARKRKPSAENTGRKSKPRTKAVSASSPGAPDVEQWAREELDAEHWYAPTGPVQRVEARAPTLIPDGVHTPKPKGDCVLLHGWNQDASAMLRLSEKLQGFKQAAGWNFWRVTYETHCLRFPLVAAQVAPLMAPLKNIVFVGFSMGGVVARQMVDDGLMVKAVVTTCAPHEGLGLWIPTPDFGSGSLSPFSYDLHRLNTSPQDEASRSKYHFFGIVFHDLFGYHLDDGVVPISSALGRSLGTVAKREAIPLEYGFQIAGVAPHSCGYNPDRVQPLIDTCGTIFAAP